MKTRRAFANVNSDGTMRVTEGVATCARGSMPSPPLPAETYILTLSRPFDPDRTHVTPVCRALVTAPAERVNVMFLSDRKVALVFLGEGGAPCSMPFTVTVEEF